MDPILNLLSDTVPKARSLEELTRPLLTILSQVTGMESTYLTTIDLTAGTQRVIFSHNTGDMTIPEGLEVPWGDTLCKRAIEQNRMYTNNVSECWGDSAAAAQLGIKTYVSAPIRAQNGDLLGTVCAASSDSVNRAPDVEPLLNLLSGLLSYSLERELLVERLQIANKELIKLALTDPLTGLPNRRAVFKDVERFFDLAKRNQQFILIGVIDLDNFKQINDTHGHLAGDEFLLSITTKLQQSLRASDIIGRAGGDEFIVLALGASTSSGQTEDMHHAAKLLQKRLTDASIGRFSLKNGEVILDYAGASVGIAALLPTSMSADEAIRLADHEMYKVKQQRKSNAS
ncbi:GGDEF domain-containing protein [Ectopseudomonas mendocina]|uniref:diguanylate cyclase n=1 Tax=Ectopseudomonas mendocina TaxID=300 RepID=A0ABZ2RKY1_ECTME